MSWRRVATRPELETCGIGNPNGIWASHRLGGAMWHGGTGRGLGCIKGGHASRRSTSRWTVSTVIPGSRGSPGRQVRFCENANSTAAEARALSSLSRSAWSLTAVTKLARFGSTRGAQSASSVARSRTRSTSSDVPRAPSTWNAPGSAIAASLARGSSGPTGERGRSNRRDPRRPGLVDGPRPCGRPPGRGARAVEPSGPPAARPRGTTASVRKPARPGVHDRSMLATWRTAGPGDGRRRCGPPVRAAQRTDGRRARPALARCATDGGRHRAPPGRGVRRTRRRSTSRRAKARRGAQGAGRAAQG
jgi:hypothetical protein